MQWSALLRNRSSSGRSDISKTFMKTNSTFQPLNRRRFIRASAALGLLAGLPRFMPAYALENAGQQASPVGGAKANEIDLVIRELQMTFGKRRGTVVTVNGTVPGPLERLREGSDAILRVTNNLKEDTSIHWH